MPADVLIVATISFFFGVANKLADLHNEHGLRSFTGAATAFGLLTGLLGAYMISLNEFLAIYYIGVTMDWFLRGKLDCFSHVAGSSLILFAGLYFISRQDVFMVAGLTLTFLLSGFVAQRAKSRLLKRSRFIIIPFAFSVLVSNVLPLLASVTGMLGVELVVNLFRNYEYRLIRTPMTAPLLS